MESYLQYRKQHASNNSSISTTQCLHLGVRQDSILGPLLFVVHTNVFSRIANAAIFIAYADDMSLFFTGKFQITLQQPQIQFYFHRKPGLFRAPSLLIYPKLKRYFLSHVQKVTHQIQYLSLDWNQAALVGEIKTLDVFFADNVSWNHDSEVKQGKWFNEQA